MTALIGKKFDDGILILADKRITARGTQECTDDVKKIIVINSKLILAYAGVKNIVDICLESIQRYTENSHSLEEIMTKSQKLFYSALDHFKKCHPEQRYDTVYILAGFNDRDETFIDYFSSDDLFQSRKPLGIFYKAFPDKEMVNLRTFLIHQVDHSQNEIPYYIQKFSAAIRMINHPMVGKNTYAVYLSRNNSFEVEINEYGLYTLEH